LSLLLSYCAVSASLISAAAALVADRYPAVLKYGSFPLLGVSGLAACAAGGEALLAMATHTAQLPLGLPWLPWQVRLDPLAGFFLILIGLIVSALALYGPGHVREFEHSRHPLAPLGIFTGLFVAGMLLVVLSDDAFMFMVAWELMSLSSYFLVAYQHDNPANRRAAFLYLLMAHIGALAILLGFGVLASFGAGFGFDAMREVTLSPVWADVAFGLALLGFGMKAGLVPLHAWLPEAHPVAPSHISALMSGVMLKVAVYGFVRFAFDLIGAVHWSWGVVALLAGSVSALLGVLYALMQHDLKRLLAYHSVENIGIIFVGLGLALVFLSTGHPTLGSLGLIAALFHCLNHAVFKSLLFMGAGAIVQHSHERDLEHMGGLLRRMPYTGFFFLVGCISISALPPFNGFASEWLTFQAALQGGVLESGVLRIVIPVSAAMLALTSALAAACFVKVYGVAFLGQARTRHIRHAREADIGMRSAQGLLALLCLLLGVFAGAVIDALNAIPHWLTGAQLPQAAAHGWLWLTPAVAPQQAVALPQTGALPQAVPEVASYSAPLVLVGIGLAWLLSYLLLHPRGKWVARRAPPWDCGFGPLSARMQYTSSAFSMPIRRIFEPLFKVDERVERATDESGLRVSALRHQLHVSDRSWEMLYAPPGRWVLAAARRVARLQTGNIRTYLAYSFFTLLVLLWLIT
jgi:Formate hydrogenlyase subunit 3/Multisubunit Na+/H+ antiporter, MnhD subunit